MNISLLTSKLLCKLIASDLISFETRMRLLRLLPVQVETEHIEHNLQLHKLENLHRLSIGTGTYLNHDVYIELGSDVTIGDNVAIGMFTKFITSTHELSKGDATKRVRGYKALPITVGNGAWICANCTILPGVTIGEGAVIAAGSVVNTDIEPHSFNAGNPAKFIKYLPLW